MSNETEKQRLLKKQIRAGMTAGIVFGVGSLEIAGGIILAHFLILSGFWAPLVVLGWITVFLSIILYGFLELTKTEKDFLSAQEKTSKPKDNTHTSKNDECKKPLFEKDDKFDWENPPDIIKDKISTVENQSEQKDINTGFNKKKSDFSIITGLKLLFCKPAVVQHGNVQKGMMADTQTNNNTL